MRTLLIITFLSVTTWCNAQYFAPGGFADQQVIRNDSALTRKWSVQKTASLSSSMMFFKGGNISMFSVPVGLQLNRRLTNNLYAFGSVTAAPTYFSMSTSFISGGFSKNGQQNGFSRTGTVGMYSRAALGLQYVNDDKTFSISGSIGVSRGDFPMMPYYTAPRNNPSLSPGWQQ